MKEPNIVNLFPLSIYINQVEGHEKWKKVFIDDVYDDYQYDRYKRESKEYNIVSEHCGKPVLHSDERLNGLFKELSDHIKKHCISTLGIRDMFDVCMVKSWLSRSYDNDENLPRHVHSATHLSFVYYMQVPPDANQLVFTTHKHQNELFEAMFDVDGHEEEDTWIDNYTFESSPHYIIPPEEGMIVVFPSNAAHFTTPTQSTPQTFQTERLAISGDCILVLKEDEPMVHSKGFINPKHWCVY
tara:strand:+ start:215 stop:940 length:726 start_codon:yes stop_codon:yes gene_type:complete